MAAARLLSSQAPGAVTPWQERPGRSATRSHQEEIREFDFDGERLRLTYPCQWIYKVIGSGHEQVRRAIAEVVDGYDYVVTFSNWSRTRKYCCLNVEMTVESEAIRTEIYTALKNHPLIRMVL
jgi:putative lipoic acid-binding regulatory protein